MPGNAGIGHAKGIRACKQIRGKASFISQNSICSIARPNRRINFGMATIWAYAPIFFPANDASISIKADAPSDNWLALPAVM